MVNATFSLLNGTFYETNAKLVKRRLRNIVLKQLRLVLGKGIVAPWGTRLIGRGIPYVPKTQ